MNESISTQVDLYSVSGTSPPLAKLVTIRSDPGQPPVDLYETSGSSPPPWVGVVDSSSSSVEIVSASELQGGHDDLECVLVKWGREKLAAELEAIGIDARALRVEWAPPVEQKLVDAESPAQPPASQVAGMPARPCEGGVGPWLSVVDAARYAGWPCTSGRAPQSFYEVAARIGCKVNGKWRIHIDDLETEIRSHGAVAR